MCYVWTVSGAVWTISGIALVSIELLRVGIELSGVFGVEPLLEGVEFLFGVEFFEDAEFLDGVLIGAMFTNSSLTFLSCSYN